MAYQQLITSLDECLNIYEELLEIGRRKKQVLVQGGTDELRPLTDQETGLLQRFEDAEHARVQALMELQKQCGLQPNSKATLSELKLLLTTDEERLGLETIQYILADRAKSLRMLNELNQQLLQQSIDLVHHSLETIVGPTEDDYVYHDPRSYQAAPKRASGIDYRL